MLRDSLDPSAFLPVGLKKQNVFITQTRFVWTLILSDNVSTTVGLINERAWNAENTECYQVAILQL